MEQLKTKSSLSNSQQRLVELMQKVNFGRIEGLRVQNGEPDFNREHTSVNTFKGGGASLPRPEMLYEDFALKNSVHELLQNISNCRDQVVVKIEVRHGLPLTYEIRKQIAGQGTVDEEPTI